MSTVTRESRAAESYQAFSMLRSRFGAAKKPKPPPPKEKRRRRDPRFDAPPLKPLVEESDVTPVPLARETPNTSIMQDENGETERFGERFVPISPLKSNVLTASSPCGESPVLSEVEKVEVSSQTSYSSAYFSLTPSLGSATELSDTASTDSFNEYDIRTRAHTAHLLKTLEHSPLGMSRYHSGGLTRNRYSSQPPKHKRPSSAGVAIERTSSSSMLFTASEPLTSVPKVSSLENILESSSASKLSLFSDESDSNSDYLWSGGVSLGKFVSSQPKVISFERRMSCGGEESECSRESLEDATTPHASQDNDPTSSDDVGIISRCVSVRDVHSPKFPQLIVVEEKRAEERHPQPITIKPRTSSECAWVRAQQKFKSMRQHRDNTEPASKAVSASHLPVPEPEEESLQSLVEERGRVFGGVRRRGGLRRTQSFHIGQRHLVSITN